MNRLLSVIVLCALVTGVMARTTNTTRRNLQRHEAAATAPATPPVLVARAACSTEVVISGYDKTRRANGESFFVSNNSGAPFEGLHITVTYIDMDGRMLHRRSEKIAANVPAAQTRQLTIPTWDRQHSFYYHLSRHSSRNPGTPYRVTINVDSIFTLCSANE